MNIHLAKIDVELVVAAIEIPFAYWVKLGDPLDD
jgi:hypothetical protein